MQTSAAAFALSAQRARGTRTCLLRHLCERTPSSIRVLSKDGPAVRRKKKQEKKTSPDEFRRRLVCAGLNVTFRRDLLDVRCDVVVFITLVFKPLQHSLLRQTRTCSEQDM